MGIHYALSDWHPSGQMVWPDGQQSVAHYSSLGSPCTAARNKTLKAPDLMAIEVPVPFLSTPRTFDAVQAKVVELKARHTTIRQANDALIPATLERMFSGAH